MIKKYVVAGVLLFLTITQICSMSRAFRLVIDEKCDHQCINEYKKLFGSIAWDTINEDDCAGSIANAMRSLAMGQGQDKFSHLGTHCFLNKVIQDMQGIVSRHQDSSSLAKKAKEFIKELLWADKVLLCSAAYQREYLAHELLREFQKQCDELQQRVDTHLVQQEKHCGILEARLLKLSHDGSAPTEHHE